MLILLFVLASLDKNPALRESLGNFLGFYRENRDLIASVLQQSGTEQPSPPSEQKKSRPEQKVDSLNILEEYLKRCTV